MTRRALDIVEEESFESGIPLSKLLGKGRSQSIVHIRRITIRKIREQTEMSLTEIGEMFDGRHHTTILHYLQI